MKKNLFHKQICFGVCIIIVSGLSHAEYDVSALQKLFTDKKQRILIDATRSGSASVTDVIKQTEKVKLKGYVTRSEGKSVVWLNNDNTLDSPAVGGVRVQRSSVGKNKKVAVSVEGKTVRLKPGEVWFKESGKIVDNH